MDGRALRRHVGLGQGIALYVSALLGAGVLVLPGQVASLAGPASLVSWALACATGIPLAWMFASLARRFPEAGGVATYVGRAFGATAGGITGWLYFVAGSVGQTIVPLTGGYYLAHAAHLSADWTYVIAAAVLAVAVAANLTGTRTGSRVRLVLAGGVGVALVATIVVAAPRVELRRMPPFAPHGVAAIGDGVVILFFAFAGWEAVAHLASEFVDPDRDVPRAVAATIAIITFLYLGIASVVVLTGTYGTSSLDHVAVEALLAHTFGSGAAVPVAAIAMIISLGTTNAFVAGVSRLAHSLARDHWLPAAVGRVDRRACPVGGVTAVAVVAFAGLALAAARGWGTETLVVVPSTLVVTVYLLAAAAACRLLEGVQRVCAILALGSTALVVPSAASHLLIPLIVVAVALAARCCIGIGSTRQPSPRRRS